MNQEIPVTTNFINDVLSNSDALAFFGALISVIFSVYIFTQSSKKSLERERYDKLVFPLFNLLEPYLFKEKNDEIFHQALQLIEVNKSIAGGKLLYLLYWSRQSATQELFISLCAYVNSELDRVSKIIGLRTRSIFYRIDRNQYRTKLMFYVYIALNSLLLLFSFVTFLFFMFLVNSLLQKLLP